MLFEVVFLFLFFFILQTSSPILHPPFTYSSLPFSFTRVKSYDSACSIPLLGIGLFLHVEEGSELNPVGKSWQILASMSRWGDP